MEHIPVRVSVCSQKGGVGKSSLTVLVASWLHYVMKRNVQVVIKGADRLREVRLFWTMVDRRERTPLYDRYTEAIERLGIHLLTTRIAYRSKFNKELLADGAGIGRSTLLAAERSFARDAGIEALAQEIRTLVIPE